MNKTITPNGYAVYPNYCQCHPETCCCSPWVIYKNVKGYPKHKHSTYIKQETAEEVAAALNKVYERG